jgi:hyperosmotically inducible protein
MKTLKQLFTAVVAVGVISLVSCAPSDSKIQKEVNDKMVVSAPGVMAAVTDGVATLSGSVLDDATKMNAENAAKEVKGVKSVTNNISVVPPAPVAPEPTVMINPDDVLRNSIDSSIMAIGVSGVSATVMNGEVTLTGTVTKADRMKVMQAANAIKPKKVINNLTEK